MAGQAVQGPLVELAAVVGHDPTVRGDEDRDRQPVEVPAPPDRPVVIEAARERDAGPPDQLRPVRALIQLVHADDDGRGPALLVPGLGQPVPGAGQRQEPGPRVVGEGEP